MMIRPANGQGKDFELQPVYNDDSDEQPAEQDKAFKQNNEARKRNLYWLTFSVPHNDSGTGISERDVSFLVELSGPERVITQQDSVPRHPASLSAQGRRIITDPANQPCCSHDIVQETPRQPESEHHPAPIRMSRESIDTFIMIARSLRGHVHRLIDQRNCLQDLLQFALICSNCRRRHHTSIMCTCGCGVICGLASSKVIADECAVSTAVQASASAASAVCCSLLCCLTVACCFKHVHFQPSELIISIKHELPPYGKLPETGIREDVQEGLRRIISSFDRIGSSPALISLNSTAHNNGVIVTDLIIEIRAPFEARSLMTKFLKYYGLTDIMNIQNIMIGYSFNNNDFELSDSEFQSQQ
ncbi:hypothetical protein [Endozoicomonas euniceicola]|uniref:Uncharacterized protein n=1 Tax=Endozoicomonas euniceicola TaxID=1234143 RepID=A0ABY6H1X9_9GAMM|nr:hypothetical protein [Endozoicomonas euniceicola]UYM18238.1 hypothetical protein NX720_10145 [Endozoicomonas euniceicola]